MRMFKKISTFALSLFLLASVATPCQSFAQTVNVWMTTDNQKTKLKQQSSISFSAGSGTAPTIFLDETETYQSIEGFGASFTDSAAYLLNEKVPASQLNSVMTSLFDHTNGIGVSFVRNPMGASDLARYDYSYDDLPVGQTDPNLTNFSISHDLVDIVPLVKLAKQINPQLKIMATPWSPPGWMKANGSMLGGSMRKQYYASYAQYFLKFLQAYAAEGVPIQAVTSQNEVDTDQDGRMPACLWGQEYEIEFVKGHLGPVLREHGIPAKIWLLDHNYNLWGRVICELDDPDVRKYANAVAWHGYAGGASMMSKAHDAHPDADMHWTEGGPDYTSPDYATDWAKWGHTFTEALRNWCQSLTGWNLALDEKGRPNIGPFPCGGLVTIHSGTHEITRSGQYWAFAHFSRLIRRGARRFDSQGILADVDHVACENPDGQRVLVITNAAAARLVALQMGMMTAELTLPGASITTLSWN